MEKKLLGVLGRLGLALEVGAVYVESADSHHQEAEQKTAHLTEKCFLYSHIIQSE